MLVKPQCCLSSSVDSITPNALKKILLLLILPGLTLAQNLVDFEDVGLGTNAFYNGSDFAGGFLSNDVQFNNTFDNSLGFDVWGGFSVSTVNDTNTPGFLNQYAVFSGTGRGGAGQYGIAFDNGPDDFLTFRQPSRVNGFYVNNTTYAALVMRDGDASFGVDPFGGPDGTEPDTFKLTIEGRDAGGLSQGSVDFYLADFRDSDSANDTIVSDWTYVDLTPLGDEVESLHFNLASTDTSEFGGQVFNNTPNYFAIDDLSYEANDKACALSGVVWNDLSNDGLTVNDDLSFLGLPDIEVQLLDTNGALLGATTTSAGGTWCLDPEPGEYMVRVIPPVLGTAGLTIPSTPTQVAVRVEADMSQSNVNFGFLEALCQMEEDVIGFVWSDLNNDGSTDGDALDALGIEGAIIYATNRDGSAPRQVAVTGPNGFFEVKGIEICQRLEVKVPASFSGGLFSLPVSSREVFDIVQRDNGIATFPVVPTAAAAEIVSQTAEVSEAGVTLSWDTGSEIDHLGFQVVWVDDAGEETVVTERLLLASGYGSGSYTVEHKDADGSGTYYVEDISTDLVVTRHAAIELERPAPPLDELPVTMLVVENDRFEFAAEGDVNVLVTGFSAVPFVRSGAVRLRGEVLEADSDVGIYLGLMAGESVEVFVP